jgi:hypothetical protein
MADTTEGANGMAADEAATAFAEIDRPSKKQKGEDGSAVAADEDMDDDMDDVDQEGEHDDANDVEDDDDGADDDDEVDDGDEVEDDGGMEDEDSRLTNMRDEALDDPGSESD